MYYIIKEINFEFINKGYPGDAPGGTQGGVWVGPLGGRGVCFITQDYFDGNKEEDYYNSSVKDDNCIGLFFKKLYFERIKISKKRY